MKRLTVMATLLAVSCTVLAAPLKTDPANSSVTAVFKQMNVPVEATFRRFTASVDYDPAQPQASKANVQIDATTLDVGDEDMNKEVAKKEWFNTAQYPRASFVSTAIRAGAAGKLAVDGKLTIKGRTANVSFPLTVRQNGSKYVFEGQLPIRRTAFSVGEGDWLDTTMVADEVIIKFRVTAAK
ncbi:MAG TPA: YceI family protein [Telluria sp.]|nr:YceI family protein [Telluria sp.]